DDASVGQAWHEWQAARTELMQAPSFPAAERLYFVAMGIYSYLALGQRHLEARALAESTLDLVAEPRFRQEMIARMARGAVNTGDIASAEGWFALLIPHSDDIHVDSGYRTTGAWIATAKNDFQGVLRFLGARIDDIPIADTSDALCAIIRANAYERMGQVQTAVEQLVQLATRMPGGAQLITMILDANRHLNLCPHASQLAQQQLGQMQTQAVRTRGGFKFGCIFIPVFVGGFALAGAMGLVQQYVDESYATILMTAMVVGFIILTFVLVFGSLYKMGALRKRLREQGVAGNAQLLGASETGTRVNNQPLVELTLMVSLPGRSPYTAIHREIVSNINLGRLAPGTNLPVRVDANDPTLMCVDW
ncbi:MAG TPA: hypothetical protein VFB62_09550, partial [Polyangiaceae bacterium]|nr:hypothetical protein [Polyangiaceae bacterium]